MLHCAVFSVCGYLLQEGKELCLRKGLQAVRQNTAEQKTKKNKTGVWEILHQSADDQTTLDVQINNSVLLRINPTS